MARRCVTWLACFMGAFLTGGCGGTLLGCIGEGTLVATPTGLRPIETLAVGDRVWSCDADGRRAVSAVTATRAAVTSDALVLRLANGHELIATAAHPVRAGGAWTRAGALRPGDVVDIERGRSSVEEVTARPGRVRVFDLTVSPHASFYAGGVLVHNKTMPPRPTMERVAGTWIGVIEHQRHYLELDADGTGRAAADWYGRTERYDIEWWRLNGYEIQIELVTDHGSRRRLQGSAHGFYGADGSAGSGTLEMRRVHLGLHGSRSSPVAFMRLEAIEQLEQVLDAPPD